jgi:hypothetical protein
MLVGAETLWLLSEFEQAVAAAQTAMIMFHTLGDHAGSADCHNILVSVYSSSGDLAQRDGCLDLAVDGQRYAAHRLF